ncbi:hypothetical protein QSJ19_18660 [Gordonia sp. ABSL11-1]|uniref:hypothetical protein n=1 Tax=Gordonia sp. ABSL11-1 TaxID=3053924 RepID=UPI00257360FE|nr:hypothetical protein [Gordonia sp. ABSL11-1]MDL9947568.1 hypothetical protein [Gordonia sp. ABSL11-1]
MVSDQKKLVVRIEWPIRADKAGARRGQCPRHKNADNPIFTAIRHAVTAAVDGLVVERVGGCLYTIDTLSNSAFGRAIESVTAGCVVVVHGQSASVLSASNNANGGDSCALFGNKPIASKQRDNVMSDTLFADISEHQPVVDESYPYEWLSIRSNDGTYRDHNFSTNWDIARKWLDAGRLRGLIVYCVYRPNWREVADVHVQMQGENRPDVVSMVDVESWGGQISGDHSDAINQLVWTISDWRGPHLHRRPRRVVGYLNPNDAAIWTVRPPIGFVIPSYGSPPAFPPGTEDLGAQMIAHQYTDGQGHGNGLPEGYGAVRCDMNAANGYNADQLRVATGIDVPAPAASS